MDMEELVELDCVEAIVTRLVEDVEEFAIIAEGRVMAKYWKHHGKSSKKGDHVVIADQVYISSFTNPNQGVVISREEYLKFI